MRFTHINVRYNESSMMYEVRESINGARPAEYNTFTSQRKAFQWALDSADSMTRNGYMERVTVDLGLGVRRVFESGRTR